MAAHDYHEELPGFHEDQIWHDGCGECEFRSSNLPFTLAALDSSNFRRAWSRANHWGQDVLDLSTISQAERPLLEYLWYVQLMLNRTGTLFV